MGETGLLFHYTDAAGLLGIARDAALWAGDAEFLNDAQELRYGRPALHRALLEAADLAATRDGPGGPQASRAQIMRSAASQIDPDQFTLQPTSHSVYVVCFCEEADVLSQWRGYAEGGGYALGFDRGALSRLSAGENTTPIVLRPVRYGPASIGPMVKTVLDAVAPRPTGHPGVTGFWAAGTVVLPTLAQVKHEAFAEEREWRLITTSAGSRDLTFRSGPRWPVPYLAISFPVEALRRVVVGPGPDADLRVHGLRKLLWGTGCEHVEVDVSEAPFRG